MEAHEYPNGEITILWKPKLCTHAAVCVRTLSKVYNPKARPWINVKNATTQELLDQVAKCPSGALSIKKNTSMKYMLETPVKGTLGTQKYKTAIHWRNGVLITDEPEKLGGKDLGPDPYTLLLSSLVACTLATLRMYIEHKGLAIPEIEVEANICYKIENKETVAYIERKIGFREPLDPEVQQRLWRVAENCPISKMLKGNINISTEFNKIATVNKTKI